jgi:hypothetical protein
LLRTDTVRQQRNLRKTFETQLELVKHKVTEKIRGLEAERDAERSRADRMKGKAAVLQKKLDTVKLQVDKF